MLNWGDKDSAERLAAQLKELLRDRTMTFDQLASVYSIKHGQSVTQRLKEMSRDRRPMTLGDFVAQMADYFEAIGRNQVRAAGVSANGGAKKASAPAAATTAAPAVGKPSTITVMKYADVSRGIQNILNEQHEPLKIESLEDLFKTQYGTSISDIVGMTTEEYLRRKENIFDYSSSRGTVFLQSAILTGPPMAEPGAVKDETFVVKEFESLIEAMGPVVYISTLCGKFIQRNGSSVTSIINTRPLDLFKRHPGVFLIVGAGNVTLKKYESMPEVSRLLDKPSSKAKAQRISKAAEEAQLPVPDNATEQDVVDEFRRLILSDAQDCVYISSLCGRFLQRFKKPVTQIITCKPAEFLRRYPDIFVMTGGGNVGLREVLGPDAVSVPPPPPRMPKVSRDEDKVLTAEALQQISLNDNVYQDIHGLLAQGVSYQAVVQQLMTVCRQVEGASFLALEEVVLGGAAGKGLLTNGPQAEIVLFVRQLPYRNFAQWLPHILETLAPVLEYQLSSSNAEKFKVDKDNVHFVLAAAGGKELPVKVFLSPLFKNHGHLLESIKATPPAERFYFYPAMVKERNEFVGRQTQQTKILIRLLTWWGSKQRWSSAMSTPSEWLIELVVIHAVHQLKQGNKKGGSSDFEISDMVTRVLEIFANFETIKVLWADTGAALYSPQDIWRPLLSHEPLFMDPLNPYCNLADVNFFDCHELVAAAQPPACFTCFKREAAQFIKISAEGEDDDIGLDKDDDYADAQES
mmetsp:Transcript_107934/g.168697  ORF Transcript_107934/g.168697 Transcript_107934/m.168697 type:complete len:746 (-) Transcript_107934:103-2340(-)